MPNILIFGPFGLYLTFRPNTLIEFDGTCKFITTVCVIMYTLFAHISDKVSPIDRCPFIIHARFHAGSPKCLFLCKTNKNCMISGIGKCDLLKKLFSLVPYCMLHYYISHINVHISPISYSWAILSVYAFITYKYRIEVPGIRKIIKIDIIQIFLFRKNTPPCRIANIQND